MKIIKPLAGLLLLGAISSCSNSELGYNEAATRMFLSEMKQIDETQQDFADSARVLHAEHGDDIIYGTKVDNTITNAGRDIQNMNDLKPSDAAQEFHKDVISYFTKIKDYGTTAKQVLTTTAADKKRELYAKLMEQYKALNQMPDQVLEVQKQYQSKVGLQSK